MNKTMMSNAPRRRARRPSEKVETPKKVKPVPPVDIENCVYVTLIDKAATSIRKQMRTKAKTSKIIFICESIAEANIILLSCTEQKRLWLRLCLSGKTTAIPPYQICCWSYDLHSWKVSCLLG